MQKSNSNNNKASCKSGMVGICPSKTVLGCARVADVGPHELWMRQRSAEDLDTTQRRITSPHPCGRVTCVPREPAADRCAHLRRGRDCTRCVVEECHQTLCGEQTFANCTIAVGPMRTESVGIKGVAWLPALPLHYLVGLSLIIVPR